jgi:hypothetical protein
MKPAELGNGATFVDPEDGPVRTRAGDLATEAIPRASRRADPYDAVFSLENLHRAGEHGLGNPERACQLRRGGGASGKLG